MKDKEDKISAKENANDSRMKSKHWIIALIFLVVGLLIGFNISDDVGALNDQMNDLGNLYGQTASQYRTHFNTWSSDMTMSGKHMKKFGATFEAIGEWKATQQETMGATATESAPGIGSFLLNAVSYGAIEKDVEGATSGAREKEAAALEVLRTKVLELARDLGRTKDGIVKFAKITNVMGELVSNAYERDIRTAEGGDLQLMSDRLLFIIYPLKIHNPSN